MLLCPAKASILMPLVPYVRLLDTRSDVSDLTTYTFTACNLGMIGLVSSPAANVYGTDPLLRSALRNMIVVAVHGEDAAVTFNVSSVTIGGVAGTEGPDRAGATNAINTAIYYWRTDQLQGIANTDIVVTFSEAVTHCAIGVMSVENLSLCVRVAGAASNTFTGTGTLTLGPTMTVENIDFGLVGIFAASCVTGGGTEGFSVKSGIGGTPPNILSAGSTAEMDYAAAWSRSPQWNGANDKPIEFLASWSGAGAGDAACAIFM